MQTRCFERIMFQFSFRFTKTRVEKCNLDTRYLPVEMFSFLMLRISGIFVLCIAPDRRYQHTLSRSVERFMLRGAICHSEV